MAISKAVHYKSQLAGKHLFTSEVRIDGSAGAQSVNVPGFSQAQCAFWTVNETTLSGGVETQAISLPAATLTAGTNKFGVPGTANSIYRILAMA